MNITREIVTVFANPAASEVHIILSGYRLVLSAEEASCLAKALSRIEATPSPAAENNASDAGLASALAAITERGVDPPEPRHIVRPSAAEAEAVQQRARALIQGTMREKAHREERTL